MDDGAGIQPPPQYERLLARSRDIGFSMSSDLRTGALLRALAASKPASSILELGTGVGLGTSWLLDGMDAASSLVSVDNDPRVHSIVSEELGQDPRLRLVLSDGGTFLEQCRQRVDLVYADAWPGKYSHLELALGLINPGGMFLVDDMLPQPNWPDGHGAKAEALAATLDRLPGFVTTKLAWSTGLMLCVRHAKLPS